MLRTVTAHRLPNTCINPHLQVGYDLIIKPKAKIKNSQFPDASITIKSFNSNQRKIRPFKRKSEPSIFASVLF